LNLSKVYSSAFKFKYTKRQKVQFKNIFVLLKLTMSYKLLSQQHKVDGIVTRGTEFDNNRDFNFKLGWLEIIALVPFIVPKRQEDSGGS